MSLMLDVGRRYQSPVSASEFVPLAPAARMPRSGDADGYFAGAFCTGLGCPLKTVTLPFGEMTPWPPPGSTTLPFGVTYPPPGRFVNMTGLCDNYLVYFGASNAAFVSQEVFEQLHGRATWWFQRGRSAANNSFRSSSLVSALRMLPQTHLFNWSSAALSGACYEQCRAVNKRTLVRQCRLTSWPRSS